MNQIVAEKSYIASRLNLPYDTLSQSELRSETLLGTTSNIPFVLQKAQKTAPTATEKLIQLNDKFVITHFCVKIKQVISAAPTDAQQGLANLYTYENEYVFLNIAATYIGASSANVKAIWNGQMSFTIDRKVFIPAFPVLAFRRVPNTQQGANLRATGGGVATFAANTGLDEIDNGLFGYYSCEPTIIDGRQTIDSSIALPTSYAFGGDTFGGVAVNNYAVLLCRGYLVVNAAS
jgi:hypothetical protein